MDNITLTKSVAKEIVCIKSDSDPFITQTALNEFCDKLDAKKVDIVDGGHFNSNARYNKFPELLKTILS